MTVSRPKSIYTFGILTTAAKDIFHSRYHAELLTGIFHEAGSLGHELKMIIHPTKKYSSLEQILQTHSLDGLLILTWRWIHPAFAKLIENQWHHRVLVFNDPLPHLRVHALFTDVDAGMTQAVSHLAKKGHREIGMIHGPRDVVFKIGTRKTKSPFIDTHLKRQGFLKAVKERKLSFRETWIRETSANTETEGYRIMKKWLREKKIPRALVCGNDDLALGALKALQETGEKALRDFSVIGFDDNEQAKHSRPPLTTLRQPLLKMGRDAVRILLKAVRDPRKKIVSRTYSPELIIRQTA